MAPEGIHHRNYCEVCTTCIIVYQILLLSIYCRIHDSLAFSKVAYERFVAIFSPAVREDKEELQNLG